MKRKHQLRRDYKLILFVLAAATCLTLTGTVSFASVTTEPEAVLWYFWGDGCPLCNEAEAWLGDLETEYPGMTVQRLEVFLNEEGKNIYIRLMDEQNREARWVPAFIFAGQVWEGFDDQITAEIEEMAADLYGEIVHLGSNMNFTEQASDAAKPSVESSDLNLGFRGSVSPSRSMLIIIAIMITVLLYARINMKKRSK